MREYKGIIVFVLVYCLLVCVPAFLIVGSKGLIVSGLYGLYLGFNNNVSEMINLYASEYGVELINEQDLDNFVMTAEEDSYARQVVESLKSEYDFKSPVNVVGLSVSEIGAFTIPDRILGKSNTIYLLGGAMETFKANNVDLKGVLAHEFGHVYYGHGGIANAISNSIHIYKTIAEKGIVVFQNIHMTLRSVSTVSAFAFFLYVPIGLLYAFRFLVNTVVSFLYLFLSRSHEYQADLFAANAVGKDEYLKTLRLLKKYYPDELSFKERLFHTHPTWDQRINYIEKHVKN